jgi:hypothetical protein
MQNTRGQKLFLMVTCNASGRWGRKNLKEKDNLNACYQQQLNMSCNSHV